MGGCSSKESSAEKVNEIDLSKSEEKKYENIHGELVEHGELADPHIDQPSKEESLAVQSSRGNPINKIIYSGVKDGIVESPRTLIQTSVEGNVERFVHSHIQDEIHKTNESLYNQK